MGVGYEDFYSYELFREFTTEAAFKTDDITIIANDETDLFYATLPGKMMYFNVTYQSGDDERGHQLKLYVDDKLISQTSLLFLDYSSATPFCNLPIQLSFYNRVLGIFYWELIREIYFDKNLKVTITSVSPVNGASTYYVEYRRPNAHILYTP